MTYTEELARALYAVGNPRGEWGTATSQTVHQYLQQAHDALDAIAALAERGGPKLLRREPTEEMVRSTDSYNPCQSTDGQCYDEVEIFTRMHDAAPAFPENGR